MQIRWKNIFVMVGWGIILATIPLQTLYGRTLLMLREGRAEPPIGFYLRPLDLLLMFFASVLVGAVLQEPERIVISYIGAIFISGLVMFIGLSLPAILSTMKVPSFKDLLYSNSLVFVFNSILLGPVMVCLIGGLLGGIAGERVS